MKYSAEISFEGKTDVEKVFAPEEKDFSHGRSRYSIKKERESIVFHIEAKDATALRSTLDSISKGLKVYEDMEGIEDE